MFSDPNHNEIAEAAVAKHVRHSGCPHYLKLAQNKEMIMSQTLFSQRGAPGAARFHIRLLSFSQLLTPVRSGIPVVDAAQHLRPGHQHVETLLRMPEQIAVTRDQLESQEASVH